MSRILPRSILGSLFGGSLLCLGCFISALPAFAQEEPLSLLPDAAETQPLSASRTIARTVDLSTLWGLTAQSLLRATLPTLPAATSSPSTYSLQRSLLLASTMRLKDKGDPLLPIRIERLLSMGDIESAQALLQAVPAQAMTPELYRLRIDTALLGIDPAPACIDIPNALQGQPSDPYLSQVQVFCEILGGKMRDAEQSLAALRTQGIQDPAFFIAAENMIQIAEPREAPSLPQPTPLHLTMLRMARMPVPADSINQARPVILRGIALSPNAPMETRLLAAERAERSGALPTDSLRQLYLGTAIPKQELTMAAAQKADGTARGRAILFRLAATQTQAAKIAVIMHALSQTANNAEKVRILRLYSAQIAQIKPTSALLDFAPSAIRALVADNRGGSAAVWLSLLRQQAQGNLDAARMLADLWPVLRLGEVSGSTPWSPGALPAWYEARTNGGQAATTVHEQLLLATTLLSSLDESIPPEDIVFLMEQQGTLPAPPSVSVPGMTALLGLGRAVKEGRKGEMVLWSLLTLKEMNVDSLAPASVLQQIIPALKQAGFEANARTLALEAALSAGL